VLHGVLKLVTSTIKATNFFFRRRVQTGSGVRTVSYPMGTGGGGGVLSRKKSGRGVKLTTHFHLASRFRMHGVIPPPPQYAFTAWCLI